MLLNYEKEVLRLGAICNISIMLKPNMHLGYRSLQNKKISINQSMWARPKKGYACVACSAKLITFDSLKHQYMLIDQFVT
jgi:hypothetical protein